MATDRQIDYVELPARDLTAIKKFYSEAFGWTFQDFGASYCSFNDGRLDGGFYQADAESLRDSGAALIVLYADQLEALVGVVVAAGGVISKEIFSFPGGRRFHFKDPNGNELAVWSDK